MFLLEGWQPALRFVYSLAACNTQSRIIAASASPPLAGDSVLLGQITSQYVVKSRIGPNDGVRGKLEVHCARTNGAAVGRINGFKGFAGPAKTRAKYGKVWLMHSGT